MTFNSRKEMVSSTKSSTSRETYREITTEQIDKGEEGVSTTSLDLLSGENDRSP